MSERYRSGPDWLDFIVVTLILIFVIFYIAFDDTGKLRDLQRRVGQLEQQVR